MTVPLFSLVKLTIFCTNRRQIFPRPTTYSQCHYPATRRWSQLEMYQGRGFVAKPLAHPSLLFPRSYYYPSLRSFATYCQAVPGAVPFHQCQSTISVTSFPSFPGSSQSSSANLELSAAPTSKPQTRPVPVVDRFPGDGLCCSCLCK